MINIKEKWRKMPITAKVSFSYAICSILQRCISFITLPLFTRLLTTEQYGQATVYSSWSSLLVIFLTLQLPYGSFSKAMVKFENKRAEYIASVEGICILLAALFILIYLPFRGLWNRLFELPTGIILLMVAEILAGSGLAFWSGQKRFEFRYKEVIAVTLATSLLSPIVQYILVINTEQKGYARIIGGAVVSILFGGTIFIACLMKGKAIYNKEYWKYAFGFNTPLLAYYLSQMVFNTSDRIMISHMVGTDKAAIYGVAYTLAIMLNFVLAAINNSYVPWFYEKLKEGKQDENMPVANGIACLMAFLLLGIIWFAPEVIKIMAGEDYMEAIWIVPPVAMSILLLFYSQLSINFEFFFERKKILVYASVGAAIANILLNTILIPVFGYYVAGYTTLVSYMLFAGANYYAMRRIIKEKNILSHGFDTRRLVIIFIVFSVIGFMGMALYNYLFIRISFAAVFLGIFMLNVPKIRDYRRMFKNG